MAGKITQSEATEKTRTRLLEDTMTVISAVLPKPKRTLDDILSAIKDSVDGLREFNPDDVSDLKDKVDSYKAIDDEYVLRIDGLEKEVRRISEIKASLQINRAKLRETMDFHMKTHDYKSLPGDRFQVTRITKTEVDYTLPEASTTYFKHYPDLMKREYSWNKTQVKNVILANPKEYKKLGKIVERSHIQFSLRKGLKE